MFVQFISPGQFVAPFSLRLYVQDVGRADAFDKCALPKTNGYDNSTIQYIVIAIHCTRYTVITLKLHCNCDTLHALHCNYTETTL